jgi:hypothetical protein
MSSVESQPQFLHPRPSETAVAGRMEKQRVQRDQENAFDTWPALFGTLLGPTKNGEKW